MTGWVGIIARGVLSGLCVLMAFTGSAEVPANLLKVQKFDHNDRKYAVELSEVYLDPEITMENGHTARVGYMEIVVSVSRIEGAYFSDAQADRAEAMDAASAYCAENHLPVRADDGNGYFEKGEETDLPDWNFFGICREEFKMIGGS